ncbi:g-protein coupled receptor Mth2 [Trichonephila clavipes]|nr:g-protein coupled receptor Mth2 [Trichonephila clavipes]
MVFKATVNDRRYLALCHDGFLGPQPGLCRSGGISNNNKPKSQLKNSPPTRELVEEPRIEPIVKRHYSNMEFVTSVNSTDAISLNSTVFPLDTWNENNSSYADNYTTYIYELYNVTNSTDPTSKRRRNVSKYYPIIVAEMIASCLCLIFSIAVYALLPEFRNVNGKNLITLSSCLLTTFLMLILDLIIRNYVPFGVCFTIAMIIHVTFLGTFFWTNVMAFDIWKTLTEMKSKGEVKKHSRKYLKYSIYAWTATTLTALPAALLEATDWVPGAYRPKFGVQRCWLSGTTAFIYYFNLPVGIILACNLIMFILIIRKLRIIKKMTAILNVKQQQER